MKNKIEKNYLQAGLVLFLVVAASIILYFAIDRYKGIIGGILYVIKLLMPIIYGLIIAYILCPMTNFFENKVFNKLANKLYKNNTQSKQNFIKVISIIATFTIVIALVITIVNFVLPELVESIKQIFNNLPVYIEDGKEFLKKLLSRNPQVENAVLSYYNDFSTNLISKINQNILPSMDTIFSTVTTSIIGAITVVLNVVVGFVVAVYVLSSKDTLFAQSKKFLYSFVKKERARLVLNNVRYAHKMFGGFLVGKLIDSIIIGLVSFIFLWIFKMPYPVLISVIIGVTNMIPYFGPFIGAIPSALLIFLISPSKSLTFLIFIIILQQFDGNVLGPKIIGNKTGLTSFWVLFAILVFGGIFGFAGLIFGVPLFAVLYGLINALCKRELKDKNLPVETSEYNDLNYIDEKTNKPVYFK